MLKRILIILATLALFPGLGTAQEASQSDASLFVGTWEGPWMNLMCSVPISIYAKLQIQPDNTCAYTYRWNPARNSKYPDKPVDQGRPYTLHTVATEDGKNVLELRFQLDKENKTLSFRYQEKGCLQDDGTGHNKEVADPCLHGRESKSGNYHGYLFLVK